MTLLGKADDTIHFCACIGPQNVQPRCPCMMRGLVQRDGRWIEPERDLGPVTPERAPLQSAHGCVCPPGSEMTCQGPFCPRKGWHFGATSNARA